MRLSDRYAPLEARALLGSPPELCFDRVTDLAADALGHPISAIGLVEGERLWFKSARGVPSPVVELAGSFFEVTLRSEQPVIVRDAAADARFRAFAFVQGPPAVRFYSGCRLKSRGSVVGVLSVMDTVPATLHAPKLRLLCGLAEELEHVIELRLSVLERERANIWFRILESALDAARDVVMVTETEPLDEPGPRIVYVNAAFTELTGYSREETIGLSPRLLQGQGTDGGELHRIRAALTRREPVTAELVNYRKDGSRFWVELSIVPVFDHAGRATHFVSVQRNVTDRKAEEQRNRRRDRLDALQRLAGGIAHNFNNLLTVISGYGYLLREDVDVPPEKRHYLEAIINSAEKASHLSAGLLVFSRHSPVSPSPIYLDRFVQNMQPELAGRIPDRIAFHVDLAAGAAMVRMALHDLHSVISELAQNAVEAVEAAGTVTIRTGIVDRAAGPAGPGDLKPGRYATLIVTDTGPGMSAEALSRVFEPFFSTKATDRGTGLAKVYGLVTKAGGGIHMDSHHGAGTTATVYLPLIEEPVQVVSGRTRGLDSALTILLVEDHPAVCAAIAELLRRLGHSVQESADAEGALGLLSEAPRIPDLLISDISLPGMDGVALAEKTKQLHPEMRVLFVTAYAEIDPDVTERVGKVPLISKPFGIAELKEKIEEAMSREKG